MHDDLSGFSYWLESLSGVTRTFVTFIILLCLFINIRYTPRLVAAGPTLLTTVGIFATFLGIALGLSHFDTTNIQASVPDLLAGLKTAFWASVFGVGAAVQIKGRELVFGPPVQNASNDAGEATGDNFLRALRSIQSALNGGDEGSLVAQVKLSRQDSNDRLDSLKKAQVDALEKLSEMGSRALVEALRDVIKDFNQKITEQFGENFKELNRAVGKLLEWQDKYKQTIELTEGRIQQVAATLEGVAANLITIVDRSGRFADIADRLALVIGSIDSVETRINEVSQEIVTALSAVSEQVPKIEISIRDLSRDMTKSVVENQKAVNSSLIESANSIRMVVQSTQEDMTKASAEFNKQATDVMEKTRQQVGELDKALARELTKSLDGLARQFTALSERFASDDGPLADKLRKIVDIAKVTP